MANKKKCRLCGKIKPIKEFRKSYKTESGYNSKCASCQDRYSEILKNSDALLEAGWGWCSKCNRWKPITEFDKRCDSKRQSQSACKRCISSNAEYYDWLKECEEKLDLGIMYCPKCERWKSLTEFNRHNGMRDGRQVYCRPCKKNIDNAYHRKNRDKIKNYHRVHYIKHKDRLSIISKKYKREHKDKVNACTRRRRANKRGNGGDYSGEQWKLLIEYYGPCVASHISECDGPTTPDHIVPVTKGGTSYIDNIQPMCFKHNKEKFVQTIDYRPDSGKYAKRLMEMNKE